MLFLVILLILLRSACWETGVLVILVILMNTGYGR